MPVATTNSVRHSWIPNLGQGVQNSGTSISFHTAEGRYGVLHKLEITKNKCTIQPIQSYFRLCMQKGRILRNYAVECIYIDQFCKACLE